MPDGQRSPSIQTAVSLSASAIRVAAEAGMTPSNAGRSMPSMVTTVPGRLIVRMRRRKIR